MLALAIRKSDEISLFWMKDSKGGDIFFDGKAQKMTSILAALATAKFVSIATRTWPELCERNLPVFDCRVCSLPDLKTCADMFMWRVIDARRNSVNMLAGTHFSHKKLMGVSTRDRLRMLEAEGVSWQELPLSLKEGSWMRRVVRDVTLSPEERASIPKAHRPPEDALFKRASIEMIDMPPFQSVANKQDVLMGRAAPILFSSEPTMETPEDPEQNDPPSDAPVRSMMR